MAGGYDVGSYTPGDGHQSFDASGFVAEAPASAPAAPAAPAAPIVPALAAEVKEEKVVTPEVKPEVKPGIKPEAEIKPEVEEQAEVREPSDVPVALQIPEFVSTKEQTPERQQYVQDFARLAPGSGLDGETAQGILEMITDAATLLPYEIEHQYVTPDEARAEMHTLFGEKQGRELLVAAQSYYKTLAPELQSYLDESGLGSDPSVLASMALAKGGWLKLSPVEAAATVQRLMKTPAWAAGDRLTMLKIHVASRMAERGEPAPSAGVAMGAAAGKANAAKQDAAKSELRELAAKKSMTEADRARWIALTKETI